MNALAIVGLSPSDAALVVDFFRRLEDAYKELDLSSQIDLKLSPQEVLPGLVRVTDLLRDEADQEDRRDIHPRFSLDGRFRHLKWSLLLSRMYPGGQSEPLVVFGNVQGHPDYLPGPPHEHLVIEVKTCDPRIWESVRSFGARKVHVEQVRTYIRMTGRSTGLLVYENRATLDVWPFVLHKEEKDG